MITLKTKLILTMLLSWLLAPFTVWAGCSGISQSALEIEYGAVDPSSGMKFVGVSPKLANQTLVASGTKGAILLEYNNQCTTIDASQYMGLLVNLPAAGGNYNGSELNAIQFVYGSDNADTIQTGPTADYIWANGGDDAIYTNAEYAQVYGGDGTDCVTLGSTNNDLFGIESTACPSLIPPSEALTSIYAQCGSQSDFSDSQVNGTWNISAIYSGITLTFEQYDDYVLAYSADYQHCSYTSGVSLISVDLTDGNDILNAQNIDIDMSVNGLGGNDTIRTGAGNDLISGGNGKDKVWAGKGNDWIIGDNQIETDHDGLVWELGSGGSSGDDDELYGEDGHDVLFGNNGYDRLSGGDDHDLVFGNAGKEDRLYGGSGEDLLVDSGGNSWGTRTKLSGGSGQDILVCESGNCELSGGGSKDFLAAITTNADVALYGGDGGDILFIRYDQIPAGTGGSGKDYCFHEWDQTDSWDICDYLSSIEREDAGLFDDAVRKAAGGMKAVHEEKLNLINFSGSTNYSGFKQKISDLVSKSKFEKWLDDRSQSVYDL